MRPLNIIRVVFTSITWLCQLLIIFDYILWWWPLCRLAFFPFVMSSLSASVLYGNETNKWFVWHCSDVIMCAMVPQGTLFAQRFVFRRRSKKTSKPRVTGVCQGKPLLTDGFPSQRASSAKNISVWWCQHGGDKHKGFLVQATCYSVVQSDRFLGKERIVFPKKRSLCTTE